MLTSEEIAALLGLPESEAAEKLLMGVTGPLLRAGIEPFDRPTAQVAYLLHRAFRMARNPNGHGILQGKPGYEARDMLRYRVESAAECSADLPTFARHLFERLGLDVAQLRPSELLWWRGVWSAAPAGAWLSLSSPNGLVDLLSASTMLGDCLYELHDAAKAAKESAA